MKSIYVFVLALFTHAALGQEFQLEWTVEKRGSTENPELVFSFPGASHEPDGMPYIYGEFEMPVEGNAHIELMGEAYIPLSAEEESAFKSDWESKFQNGNVFQAFTSSGQSSFIRYRVFPFRINEENHRIEKLVSFDVVPVSDNVSATVSNKSGSWASHSVLASGSWVKMAITESGMYGVPVSTLQSAGLNLVGQSSADLHIYHNPGGMLPEPNAAFRYDDLAELAIRVEDGGDGILNASDKIYFYAEGPHRLRYVVPSNISIDPYFTHDFNVYSDRSYVFATVNSSSLGLRVQEQAWTGGTATFTSSGFDDYQFHEVDERNIVGTGREWYGEIYDFSLSQSFTFSFPNRIQSENVVLRAKSAAKSLSSTTKMEYSVGGVIELQTQFSAATGNIGYTSGVGSASFQTSGNSISVTSNYNRSTSSSSVGYLDYISMKARRAWTYATGGFVARDHEVISPSGVVSYAVSNTSAWVWDVTNPIHPFAPERNGSGAWNSWSDSLRTYVVCTPSDAKSVGTVEVVANQDLHGLVDVDMLIVAHPNFMVDALRLAQHHRDYDGLIVEVVTPQQVYNEFSCGAQDVTAIRDFTRMLYVRNSTPLQYLLLFGDASYDYKNRVPNMHNFVPIYESPSSNSLYSSYMTDDYFGYLDETEGVDVVDELGDVNIGRLPVKTASEAKAVVDKIIDYVTAETSFGDWRNRLAFVSDDVDESWESVLTTEPELISQIVDTTYPAFNIEKIYSDSYTQVSTSGSQAYPDAREALYRAVQKGNLVTSYTGHGGEVGWSSERLLQLQDVNSWSNGIQLPLFITITCEFSRLDDPYRVSAGEQLLLNPDGGAVGLISTTRVVFVSGAIALNRAVLTQIFEEANGLYPTLGETVRRAKNKVKDSDRIRFSLLGDPAMRLNVPRHRVVLDSINGDVASVGADTIRAREPVELEGRIFYDTGAFFSDFEGEIVVTIFDKSVDRQTKRNDGVGPVVNFTQQENIIYKGRASVDSGYWKVSFIVPRDINFSYGQAKISFYADNGTTDAMGADKDIVVGGLGTAPFVDDAGPDIRLFMNDTNFIDGGLTDESPIGLALLTDSSGINVVGNGLGHNIIGILDGDESKSFNLNAYYTSDLNTYQSGVVNYPFFNLSDGKHNLRVRVWDVMNNVSEATVNFYVADRESLVINDLFNYPNPFTGSTTFSFEHNRDGEELEVELYISDMSGRIVHSQAQTLTPEGNRTLDMTWDATTGSGAKVAAGVYVFRLVVRSKADGSEAQQSERLVYLK